jgi:predicted O-methyltransferase YrrM
VEHFWQTIEGWSQFEDQGMLLRRMLPQSGHLRIAEIGVYCGRGTAMWIVELLNSPVTFDYFAIDNFKGSADYESENLYEKTIQNLAPILDKVNVLKMDSIEAVKRFPDGYFDVVYIDGAHDYESVKKDVNHWFPKVRKDGYIAGDDYVKGWPGVVRAVDEFLKRHSLTLIRVGKQQWAAQKTSEKPAKVGFWKRVMSS